VVYREAKTIEKSGVMVRVTIPGRDKTGKLEEVVVHFGAKHSDVVIFKLR